MPAYADEKGAPALIADRGPDSPAVAPDRPVADHDAQLLGLAWDVLAAPERVGATSR